VTFNYSFSTILSVCHYSLLFFHVNRYNARAAVEVFLHGPSSHPNLDSVSGFSSDCLGSLDKIKQAKTGVTCLLYVYMYVVLVSILKNNVKTINTAFGRDTLSC